MSWLFISSIILIGFGALGGILLTIDQFQSGNDSRDEIIKSVKTNNKQLVKQLTSIEKERNELKKDLELRDSKVEKQGEEIINLNRKLSEKSEYISNYLTGGEGYPFIDLVGFEVSKADQAKLYIKIENNFDLPLYNINFSIKDYDMIENLSYYGSDNKVRRISEKDYYNSILFKKEMNEIPPHQWNSFESKIPQKPFRFHINIRTKNGVFIEKVVAVEIIKGYFWYGFQLFDNKGNLLLENIKKDMIPSYKKMVLKALKTIPVNLELQLME
nr:hypothetical protein [Pseudopedobacter sp.]